MATAKRWTTNHDARASLLHFCLSPCRRRRRILRFLVSPTMFGKQAQEGLVTYLQRQYLIGPASQRSPTLLACEEALRGALAAGREKEEELAFTSLEFEFRLQFACGSFSTELSDFRQSVRSGNIANVNKHCKTRALGNDVVTYAISADQHSVSTFSMQMFKSQRRSCELSFLFPPRRQSPPE